MAQEMEVLVKEKGEWRDDHNAKTVTLILNKYVCE